MSFSPYDRIHHISISAITSPAWAWLDELLAINVKQKPQMSCHWSAKVEIWPYKRVLSLVEQAQLSTNPSGFRSSPLRIYHRAGERGTSTASVRVGG